MGQKLRYNSQSSGETLIESFVVTLFSHQCRPLLSSIGKAFVSLVLLKQPLPSIQYDICRHW